MNKTFRKFCTLITVISMIFLLASCSNSDQISIKTAKATEGEITAQYQLTGALVPDRTADVSAAFNGKVISVPIEVGQKVGEGTVLVKLDDSQLNAQLSQAQANYANTANQAESSQNQAKINLDNAQKNLDRTKGLYAEGAVAKTKLEEDQKAYDLALTQYNASRTATGTSTSSSKANIDSIHVQIANATIKSPISGVVLNKNIVVGENATIGTPLVTVADMSVLKLKGTIPQEAIPYIKQGDLVELFTDIYPDKTFQGTIKNIAQMSVSTGSYFPVEVTIPNNENLPSGISAHTEIKAKGTKHVIVPTSAVVENDGQSYVFIIKDNVAKKVTVTTGLRNDHKIEIIKGLKVNEEVAKTNVKNLFDGMPVQVRN